MRRIELLAPAKNLESGKIAIQSGADAVYIGAPKFGARQAVGNSLADIEALVRYAHIYWARVYVTVNTLLTDAEIEQAEKLCKELYEVGVDALIIQDTGLLEADLPPIPLYASTQMHNYTPERVAFLEQVGIQRVILARELSLAEIREIRKATKVELETFIHGALCVCYSGQCALSYAIGGRSGNRGQCAQPCRRAYSLVDRNGDVLNPAGKSSGSHLLSLKDLNLTAYLRDLLEVGVCSFKIEGRLKDQAYVKNVVAHYRQQLDGILPDYDLHAASSGHVNPGFSPDPAKTFNRGYTSYFLKGERDEIPAFDTPKHKGEPVGVVVELKGNSFRLNTKASLQNGDGLTFLNPKGALTGTLVNGVDGYWITPAKIAGIEKGAQICRNADRVFLRNVEKAVPDRRIAIQLHFTEKTEGFQLTAEDEDGITAVVKIDSEKQKARDEEKARSTIHRQLTRLGESEFVCAHLHIDLEQVYFLPISSLNALRRAMAEKLRAEREKQFPRLLGGAVQNEVPYPEKKLTFLGNVLNQKAAAFYERHGVEVIEPAAESGLDLAGRKVMTTKHCLKYEFGGCPLQEHPVLFDEPLFLIDENGRRLRLGFNCKDCFMEVYYDAGDTK